MTIPPGLHGMSLLNDPLYNKGSAFTEQERKQYGLAGLLPQHVETLEEQAVRAYEAFVDMDTELHRHIYLRQLQDSNEVLFYRLLSEHIEEMLPIVYTPTVGDGCQNFSHIYRRPRGLFVSYPERDNIACTKKLTSSSSPMASAYSASVIKVQVAWVFRSASCRCIR
jgi:malate dehydrogenase (oxaloacetate-decarboxylating)